MYLTDCIFEQESNIEKKWGKGGKCPNHFEKCCMSNTHSHDDVERGREEKVCENLFP